MAPAFHHIFFLKNQKNSSSELVPIYLRITVSGKRAEISINRKIERCRWISNMGRASGNRDIARTLNIYLELLENKLYETYNTLIRENVMISAISLKNKYTGLTDKERMLISIFQKHNDEIAALVPKHYSAGTLEKYKITLSHTVEYLRWKYNVSDFDVRNISHEFISGFDFFLRSIRNCSSNTAVKYIKNFKKIVRICIANAWILKDPFVMYKLRIKEVEIFSLTEDEIQTIADKTFATDRLTHVRDLFLFCCFTGLAYADVKKLKNSHISKGVDGEQWIFINRHKTGMRSAIPLLPMTLRIIEKYANHPLCVNKDMPLPVPSNQKLNEYLKEIAAVCGINKVLTSHIARHTFATTITLCNGVPIETVSKMLGHSSLRQTQHYAKVLDVKVGQDMQELRNRLS